MLYNDSRWVVRLLWAAFTLCLGFRIAHAIYSTALATSEPILSQLYQQTNVVYAESMVYSPLSQTCQYGANASYTPTAIIALPALLDILLLVLTVFKAMRIPSSMRANSIVCVKSQLSSRRTLR